MWRFCTRALPPPGPRLGARGWLQVRARSVPLVPRCRRGSPCLSGDSGDTERDWAAEAVTGVGPATLRAALGYLESSPNLHPGEKVCPVAGTRSSEAQVQCKESGWGDSASSLVTPLGSLSLCPVVPLEEGTLRGSQTVSYSAPSRAAAVIDGVRPSTWELVQASGDF